MPTVSKENVMYLKATYSTDQIDSMSRKLLLHWASGGYLDVKRKPYGDVFNMWYRRQLPATIAKLESYRIYNPERVVISATDDPTKLASIGMDEWDNIVREGLRKYYVLRYRQFDTDAVKRTKEKLNRNKFYDIINPLREGAVIECRKKDTSERWFTPNELSLLDGFEYREIKKQLSVYLGLFLDESLNEYCIITCEEKDEFKRVAPNFKFIRILYGDPNLIL